MPNFIPSITSNINFTCFWKKAHFKLAVFLYQPLKKPSLKYLLQRNWPALSYALKTAENNSTHLSGSIHSPLPVCWERKCFRPTYLLSSFRLKYSMNDKFSCPAINSDGTCLIGSYCILIMIILINITTELITF